MDSKINWYKEVLALEPGSKLFFPLSQLYAESGQYVEALEVLTQGLDHHPEFLEAQLFQVEILSNLDRTDEAQELVADLIERFTVYPAFWQEWADLSMKQARDKDLGLALNFLAAAFKGSPIGWAEIMDRGLRALLSEQNPDAEVRGELRETVSEIAAQVSRNELLQVPEEADEPEAVPVDEAPAESALQESAAEESAAEADAPEESIPDDEAPATKPATGESYSLRTRSMAELLARQGDYDGAVDIYRELVENAPDGEARQEFADRLAELRGQMDQEFVLEQAPLADEPADDESSPEASAEVFTDEEPADEAEMEQEEIQEYAPADGEGGPETQSRKQLADTLETLAQRLEARASS